MPLDTATKKTLEATEAAKKADKKEDKTKKLVKPGDDFAQGAAALKPKTDNKKKDADKKATPEVKAAKKEAVKKEPAKPEQAAKKIVEKKDDPKLSKNALHDATVASLNAAKFNEKELKHWIATCSDMLKQADKDQVQDLQGCIARFTQAIEAMKTSKGLDEKVLAKFVADANAKDLDAAAAKELIEEGEDLLPQASKSQLGSLKKAIDKLHSNAGAS